MSTVRNEERITVAKLSGYCITTTETDVYDSHIRLLDQIDRLYNERIVARHPSCDIVMRELHIYVDRGDKRPINQMIRRGRMISNFGSGDYLLTWFKHHLSDYDGWD